jgi:enamine deaminase RidA (YjgF/YER057c/UK114 family)
VATLRLHAAPGTAIHLTGRADTSNASTMTFFPEPGPARATVQAGLVTGRPEIDCIASVPEG